MSSKTFKDLYQSKMFADVTFVFRSGHKMQAHKCILSSKCSHFASMFFGQSEDTRVSEVLMLDTDQEAFDQLIRFAYLGHLEVFRWTLDKLTSLLSLSHEYGYTALVDAIVQEILCRHFTLRTLPQVYEVSLKYGLKEVQTLCLKFADNEAEALVADEELFGQVPFSLLDSLILREEFMSLGESFIRAVVSWTAKHSTVNALDILTKLPYECLSRGTLGNLVRSAVATAGFVPDKDSLSHVRTDDLSQAYISVMDNVDAIQHSVSGHFELDRCSIFQESSTQRPEGFVVLEGRSNYEKTEADWLRINFLQPVEANKVQFSLYGDAEICRVTVTHDYEFETRCTPIFEARTGMVTTLAINFPFARIMKLEFLYRNSVMINGLKCFFAGERNLPKVRIH